jgi:hypothetical protein
VEQDGCLGTYWSVGLFVFAMSLGCIVNDISLRVLCTVSRHVVQFHCLSYGKVLIRVGGRLSLGVRVQKRSFHLGLGLTCDSD